MVSMLRSQSYYHDTVVRFDRYTKLHLNVVLVNVEVSKQSRP